MLENGVLLLLLLVFCYFLAGWMEPKTEPEGSSKKPISEAIDEGDKATTPEQCQNTVADASVPVTHSDAPVLTDNHPRPVLQSGETETDNTVNTFTPKTSKINAQALTIQAQEEEIRRLTRTPDSNALTLTLEEKTAKLREAYSRYHESTSEAERYTAANDIETWSARVDSDPADIENKSKEKEAWDASQQPANEQAAVLMGTLVPKGCNSNTPIKEIVQWLQTSCGFTQGCALLAAKRIRSTCILHLLHASREYLESRKYAFYRNLSNQGLDIIEVRALIEKLQSVRFTNDEGNQTWYDNLVQKYKDLVKKEASFREKHPSEERWNAFLQSQTCPKWLRDPAYRKEPMSTRIQQVKAGTNVRRQSNRPPLSMKEALAAAAAKRAERSLNGAATAVVS